MLGPLLSLALLADGAIVRRTPPRESWELLEPEVVAVESRCCFRTRCLVRLVRVRMNFHAELHASADLLR